MQIAWPWQETHHVDSEDLIKAVHLVYCDRIKIRNSLIYIQIEWSSHLGPTGVDSAFKFLIEAVSRERFAWPESSAWGLKPPRLVLLHLLCWSWINHGLLLGVLHCWTHLQESGVDERMAVSVEIAFVVRYQNPLCGRSDNNHRHLIVGQWIGDHCTHYH